ncbi:MAG: sodium:proton antiporter [Phycisphaerales bacterium]|nr:sodium:proton antiporter [Phycisphaerales bacterium]
MSDDHATHGPGFHGPRCWIATALAGLAGGAGLALLFPAFYTPDAKAPLIFWPQVLPFALLLISIAVMPFINLRFWHRHYPDFAFFLGGLSLAYYLVAFGRPGYHHGLTYGQYKMLHSALEYYAFIALVGGLYVVSGGILVDVRGRGGPVINSIILIAGAALANLVGTTGASMLLIRPFMRINKGRLRPIHIVFFIFIVSNCGGCLTPIGDPPLYLGFLRGVPFFWTLQHFWQDWALVVGALTAVFFIIDSRIGMWTPGRAAPVTHEPEAAALAAAEIHAPRPGLAIRGAAGLVFLALMIAGVFIDPALKKYAHIEDIPVGATFQILIAAAAYFMSPKDIHQANDFDFGPVKEVGLLFLGIFFTMAPALAYLSANASSLGLDSPTKFYYATGALSAFLDNAPTYVNFLQAALAPEDLNRDTIAAFLATPAGVRLLYAISTGAVFFGAMTYIGNGPNFMVKAIADAAGVRMPSFFAYLGLATAILLPILVLHWAIFVL